MSSGSVRFYTPETLCEAALRVAMRDAQYQRAMHAAIDRGLKTRKRRLSLVPFPSDPVVPAGREPSGAK